MSLLLLLTAAQLFVVAGLLLWIEQADLGLGDFVEDPNDLIWAIVQAVFWVHLNRAQPNCDSGVEYESFRECAIALAVELEGTAQ